MNKRPALLLLITAMCSCFPVSVSAGPANDTGNLPNPTVGSKPPMPEAISRPTVKEYRVQTWVSGLDVPWDIAFVSKTRAYVTERPGRVRLVLNGKLQTAPYAVIRSAAAGEGGVMGIALDPQYPRRKFVYIMYTYRSGGAPYNRVSRYTDTGKGLANEKIIISGIRGQMFHDGGALRFGPDGLLYVGTGDAGRPASAQDKSSLNGKILRMTIDGKAPADNPFPGSVVYAYGFRNVQGLAWNPRDGRLWATMHGPTGEFGLEAMDCVFIVKKGGNHGWPSSLGVTGVPGITPPVLWFPSFSVPPALATFYNSNPMPGLKGNFFFCSLRDEDMYRVVLSGPKTISRIERWFNRGVHDGVYGRMRAVVVGPDGALYISTSNRDGRDGIHAGDDRILRISPR